ncbi:MAG: TolC family protein [Myxococcota bacterium]
MTSLVSSVDSHRRALAHRLVAGLVATWAIHDSTAWAYDDPDITLSFEGSATATAAARPPEAPSQNLDLAALFHLATQESFQVAVSQAQVQEARALQSIAVSLAYPRGQVQVLFGGPTTEAQTTVQNDINTLTPSSFEGDLDFGELGVTLRGNATAAIPIYTFGQLEKGKLAASKLVKASHHQVNATRGQVLVDLSRSYWGWQLLRELVASLDEGERRLAGVLEQIEELLDADSGQVTENDRLRLKFALSTLSVRRAQADGGLAQLEQAIKLLIGRKQSVPLVLAEESLEKAAPSELLSIDELVARARADRADIRALAEVVAAQKAFRELRIAQIFPTVFFGGFINFAVTTNATDQTNPFIKDTFNFFDGGVGLGVQLDLDFFTKLAQVEQAEAQLAVRTRQQVLAQEAAELEVRSLHAQIRAEIEQAKRLERAYLSARGWLTASTLAYDIGAGQADELIDAFLAWATSIAELQSTRYDNLVHFAELARATGRLAAVTSE